MKSYPGLTKEETERLLHRGQKRCGKCKACKLVEQSKGLYMPTPPFDHADDLTVKSWNRLLFENPCLERSSR